MLPAEDGTAATFRRGFVRLNAEATGTVVEVACGADACRKFYDAPKRDTRRSYEAATMIRLVLRGAAGGLGPRKPSSGHAASAALGPASTQLHAWLVKQRVDALPKSPMGDTLIHWYAPTRYATDLTEIDGGQPAIDHDAAERAIRPQLSLPSP